MSSIARDLLTYVSDVFVVYAKSRRRFLADKKLFIARFDRFGNLRPAKSYQLVLVMDVTSRILAPIPGILLRDTKVV